MTPEQQKKQVGQYYLMGKIAQGGMAEIFKGLSYDVHGLKKTVCIKKILPHLSASEEFIDSLISEAKLAVKLVHGNIAQTYDLGKVGDDYFMVMEFVDGKSLSQIHKKCQTIATLIPIQCLLYFISEVSNGLNYMHRRTDDRGEPLHIVHRDISPQNIMVSFSGTVKIIDFGIAKAAFKASSTDSGILKGKFAYMSPEQAHGDNIDQRSDIFSLGVILHEMLTGRRLFKGDDSRETIRNVRRAKVDPPSSTRQDIPDELDRIVMRSLAKDRRHRYLKASDMHAELVKFLYTTYPDFKPSDAAIFVQELFREETKETREPETDAKTPHLIIDRSNSALADGSQFEATGIAHAPTDMREYMLEESTVRRGPEFFSTTKKEDINTKKKTESSWPEVKALDEEERTTPRWRQTVASGSRPLIIAIIATAIIVSASFAVLWIRRQPNYHPRPKPPVSKETLVTVNPPNIVAAPTPPPLPPVAIVEIISEPPGATVFIDDQQTSYKTPAVIKEIKAPAEHKIGLYLDNYRFWDRSIVLKAGETKSFDVNLALNFGSVSIDSSPQRALVMVNGLPVGQTPLVREELTPGHIYKVEAWLEGFKPISQEIKAIAGRREELHLVLTPEAKTPPTTRDVTERKENKKNAGSILDKPASIDESKQDSHRH